MHTGCRATSNLCDGVRKCSNLGLKLCAFRRLAFEEGNEHGQFGGAHEPIVFSIPVTWEQPQTNPGLTRRRTEDTADGVSKRLREIALQRVIWVSDEIHRN